MKSPADIIALWPSAEHFAADLRLKYPSYGRVMKMRRRIPPHYWDAVTEAARGRGISLTREEIAAAHAPAPSEGQAA